MQHCGCDNATATRAAPCDTRATMRSAEAASGLHEMTRTSVLHKRIASKNDHLSV